MSPKMFLGAVALALVLFAGTRDRDPEPDTAVAAAELVPAPQPVPLEVSETTPPPGWEAPAPLYPDEQALVWVSEFWDATKWGWLGAAFALAIIAAMVVALERDRHG